MIPLKDHSACKYDHHVVNVPRNFFLSSSSHQFLFLSFSMFLSSFSPCLLLFPFPFSPSIFIFRFSLIFSVICLPHLLLFRPSSFCFPLLCFSLPCAKGSWVRHATFFHIGYALTNTARTHNFDAGSYFDIVNCFNVAQHVALCAGPRNRRTHRAEC